MQEDVIPEITGLEYGPQTDLAPGLDVCVFTEDQKTRPWLGRVLEVFPEELTFDIHWYQV